MHPRTAPALLFLAVVLVAGLGLGTPRANAAAFGSDTAGAELMRLTNLDRAALGKPALAIDPTLAGIAGSEPFACPSNRSLVLAGRAGDMASRSYFDHVIPGCGTTVLDILASDLDYNTMRGENIAWNDYPAGPGTYDVGCDDTGANCTGPTTDSTTIVAVAERGFLNSPFHRATILGNFDRFGCGSAVSADGRTYFACLFSLGGPSATPPPTPAPRDVAAPRFVALSGAARALAAGRSLVASAKVADNAALRSLSLSVDGRMVRSWTISGQSATRSTSVPASLLRRGSHVMRWTLRDAAGHTRSTGWTIVVR
jgi:hypothetical protein